MSAEQELPEQTPAERRRATTTLLRLHKGLHQQAIRQGDDKPPVSELVAIARLETSLENGEAFERLRALTREDDRPGDEGSQAKAGRAEDP